MDLKIESLPIIALLIVVLFMTYTNVVIIADFGRTTSLIPLVFVILLWLSATLKIRRRDNVH